MRFNLLTILIVLCSTLGYSQTTVQIDGTLLSSSDHLPLESASVYVLNDIDSSLVTYTITDDKGRFELTKKTNAKRLKLYISFIGFKSFVKEINPSSTALHLGNINLEEAGMLNEVELSIAPPVVVKKDTIEFNAESFKTKKDATVEDLLKKLPGVKISKDGKILVNGKEVKDIKVNGKSFFGSDPTIAIKNLTKDMIEKVQISDAKTKDQAFTGEEGDGESKSINLTIKEEKNKGVFGKLKAGGGTDSRYQYAGLVNQFNNDRQISVLLGGNNINEPGFGFGELNKMFNSSILWGNNGVWNQINPYNAGINRSNNFGVTYNDKWFNAVDASLNYFGSTSDLEQRLVESSSTAISDTSLVNQNLHSNSNNTSNSHTFAGEFEYKKDTTWHFTYKPQFTLTEAIRSSQNNRISGNNEMDSVNYSDVFNGEDNNKKSLSNDLTVVRNIGGKGTFLRLGLWMANKWDDDTGETKSSLTTRENNIKSTELRDQISNTTFTESNYGSHFKYRQALKPKKIFWDSGIRFNSTTSKSERNTKNFDTNTEQYSTVDSLFSNNFEYLIEDVSPYTGIRYKSKKLTTHLNFELVNRKQKLTDIYRPNQSTERDDHFLNITYWLRYKLSRNKSIYASLRNRNTSPTISQVQTNQNNTNPLNIVTGNPNLKSSQQRRYYVNYNNYDYQKQSGFYVYFHGNMENDRIVQKTIIDPETLVRRTTFDNVSGNYRHSGGLTKSFDMEIDSVKTWEFEFDLNSTISRDFGFINEDKYEANAFNINPGIEIGFDLLDKFYLGLDYQIDYQRTKYSSEILDVQESTIHTIGFNTEYSFNDKLRWENNISYNYNTNIGDGFKQDFILWNSSLVYEAVKDKIDISLKAYDILDQNTSTRRNIFGNTIQDTENLVLKQYFILSFTWKFNTLGAKGETGKDHFYYRS